MSLNVFHIVSLAGIGGVQRHFLDTVGELALVDKLNRHSIITKSQKPLGDFANVEILYLRSLFCVSKLVIKLLFCRNIIHIYNKTAHRDLYLLKILARRSKIILHERGNVWNLEENRLARARRNCRLADGIIANSFATKSFLIHRLGISDQLISVIHNGVPSDSEKFKPNRNGNKFHVVFVGRIEPHKGLTSLLEAISCADKCIELSVIGDGVLLGYFKEKYREKKNIEFCGRQNNIVELLKEKADLLVVPSIREPFGNVVLEGGLAGIPVIASCVDGLPEIIDHQQTGILVTPTNEITPLPTFNTGGKVPSHVVDPINGGLKKPREIDPETLLSELVNLKDDLKLRNKLARNLHYKVRTKFHSKRYVEEIAKYYVSFS